MLKTKQKKIKIKKIRTKRIKRKKTLNRTMLLNLTLKLTRKTMTMM